MSGDLISRTDLIEKIKNTNGTISGKDAAIVKDVFEKALNYAIYLCEQAPAVEQKQEQKHGHWIVIEQDVTGLKRYECSNCGKTDDDYSEPIFCKHCGCANGRTGKVDEVTE